MRCNLIAAVVGVGQALELDVVAEGIEETGQWVALQALGCHYRQGYLFSRPLPAAESLAALGSRDGPAGLSPRPG
jgi:EAL domain-containing protein (putative c-di-GMP-specific phosphodiesterase class I)